MVSTSNDSSLPSNENDPVPYPGTNFTSATYHAPYPAIASQPTDLTGRIVFVSGGTSTLGRTVSLALVHAGVSGLVLTAREGKMDILDEIEDAIHRARADDTRKVKVLKVTLDVLSSSSIAAAISRVREAFGTVDTLLNVSARIDALLPISSSDPVDWWATMETNVKGMLLVSQAVLPLLKESQADVKWIVNYGSIAAFSTTPFCSAYCMSKLAVLRLTEMFHEEVSYSGSESRISVVAIHTGNVASPLTDQSVPAQYRDTLIDAPELSAESIVWLIKERRKWLSGRYVSCTWDLPELERKKDMVEKGDLLKMKLSV